MSKLAMELAGALGDRDRQIAELKAKVAELEISKHKLREKLVIECARTKRLKKAQTPRPIIEAPRDANIIIIFEDQPEVVRWVPQPNIPGWYRSSDSDPIYPDTDQWWPTPTPEAGETSDALGLLHGKAHVDMERSKVSGRTVEQREGDKNAKI